MALQNGRRLGPHEVIEPIGAGGMGEVYRARDTKLGRDVAIKVLPSEVTQSPESRRRFEREAQLLASLSHPNMATVYGLEEADGIHYLVMELVPGETLAEILARGPLPAGEAAQIVRQLIDGLEAAHESGIVHRDLKPANIKVTPDGVVRILDFGLAKAFGPEAPAPERDSSLSPTLTRDVTRAGVILGTAAYMSPEQARGKSVDKRSDIFSFGAVVFEMLTGARAFEGETVADILAAVIEREPDWTKLPSSRVAPLIRRCLEKDPRRRLRDIGDARIELDEARSAGSDPRPREARPTRRAVWLAAGVAVGIAATLFVVREEPRAREVTRFTIPAPSTTRYVSPGAPDFTISPDGSRIVFSFDRTLYLRNMSSETLERIPGTDAAQQAFFSPDGQSVAFISLRDRELKKASLTGGPVETIARDTTGVLGADWKEGTIVYAKAASGLWRVSASGGEPELVIANDPMTIRYPSLIGGGKVIFTDVGDDRGPERFRILAASLETGEIQSLGLRGTQPKYVRDGFIIYVDDGTLMGVRFDRDATAIDGAPVPLEEGFPVSGMLQAALFAISESGTLVHMPSPSGLRLERVAPNGETLSSGSEARGYQDIRFSPDGTRAAVMDNAGPVDIWVYDVARDALTPVTSSAVFDEVPVWSPDGRFVAYTTATELSLTGITQAGRVVNRRAADGSGTEETLWETPHHAHLGEWIEGGTFVLTEQRPETGWDISMLRLNDDPPQTYLMESRFDERNPRLDPSGRWLAYESDQSGAFEIYVTPFPDASSRYIVSDGGGAEPVWSADGRELFYRTPTDVMKVPIEGSGSETFSAGRPVPLFPNRFDEGGDHTPYDVDPSGTFLFAAATREADSPYRSAYRFVVVRNWIAEVEAKLSSPD